MSRLFINGQWTTAEKLEKEFGAIKFEGKKYILTDMADITNRLLDIHPNYNEPDEEGNYYFEMASSAIDETGKEFKVYWIFKTEEDKELDQYDYTNIDRIIEQ